MITTLSHRKPTALGPGTYLQPYYLKFEGMDEPVLGVVVTDKRKGVSARELIDHLVAEEEIEEHIGESMLDESEWDYDVQVTSPYKVKHGAQSNPRGSLKRSLLR